MSDVSLSGNMTMDVQTLQSMVDQGGAAGNQSIQDFALAVMREAQQKGNGQEAQAASNIAGSLNDGTYSQGASNDALYASLQGQSVDSVGLGIENTRNRIVSGDSSSSIAHDLDALGTEIGGDDGAKLRAIAAQVSNGTATTTSAVSLLNQLGQQHGLPDVTTGSSSGAATTTPLSVNLRGGVEQGEEAGAFFAAMFGSQQLKFSSTDEFPTLDKNEKNA
ncbi:hypothetical protein [Acetobacter sp. P1H12_c]|uniref:hypothetical protein n=1 Tax=Acetobacter sp. P1H12_c TaxID=2762621 RepID=UPI001C05B38F|nr:hypothetical protein [Acetobacter sp. P1H12_c]